MASIIGFLFHVFSSEDNVFLSPIQVSDASESLEEKRNMVTRLGPNSRPTSPLIPVRAPADQIPGGGDSQIPPIGIESNASLLDLAYKTALGKFNRAPIVHFGNLFFSQWIDGNCSCSCLE